MRVADSYQETGMVETITSTRSHLSHHRDGASELEALCGAGDGTVLEGRRMDTLDLYYMRRELCSDCYRQTMSQRS